MRAPIRHNMVCTTSSEAQRDAYLAFQQDVQIDDVVAAGATSAEVVVHDDGRSVEVRYVFASREAFEAYQQEAGPRIRARTVEKFPAGLTFTRTVGTFSRRVGGMGPSVGAVPLLRDNYAYLLRFAPRNEVVIVDPSEGAPVLAEVEKLGLRPVAVWCTHHHPDHVGGVPEIVAKLPDLPVLGSAYDLAQKRIAGQTRGLEDGEEVTAMGRSFRVLSVPGHTLGAIAYVGEGVAFTGDTLFLGGCGRVFEGTMPMMHASLRRLSALDPETQLFVGHEYTAKNLEFAAAVEPDSKDVAARLSSVRAARERGEFTVPGTVRVELATNPFLRAHLPSVRAFAEKRGAASTADDVFARVREAKDSF